MQIGLVVGSATSTVKHPSLQGAKLLLVQLLMRDGRSPDGDPFLAIDRLGAGIGETVVMTSDGRSTRELLKNRNTPARWNISGLIDE